MPSRSSRPVPPLPFLAAWTCPGCRSDAAHVVHRRTGYSGRVRYTVRCGECQRWRSLVMSAPLAARLERTLASQRAAIELQADRLAAAL